MSRGRERTPPPGILSLMKGNNDRKFVWPPNPVGIAADPGPGDPDAAEVSFIEVGRNAEPASFPAAARETPWQQVESTWFGVTAAPLLRRAQERGFVPDTPERYCPRCGRTRRGPVAAGGDDCAACRDERIPWDRVVRLGEYEGLLGEVVRELKFQRWRRVGMDLGVWMGAALESELRRRGVRADRVLLTPVPSHWTRRLIRGIDHAAVLARAAASAAGVRHQEVLGRGFRLPQGGLGGEARRRNLTGTMRWLSGSGEPGVEVVVVVDDVMTTGATLREATRAIRGREEWGRRARGGTNGAGGPEIWCLVGCRSGD
ncbi:MAG: ComF family protein [Phycisphaerales bacterium]